MPLHGDAPPPAAVSTSGPESRVINGFGVLRGAHSCTANLAGLGGRTYLRGNIKLVGPRHEDKKKAINNTPEKNKSLIEDNTHAGLQVFHFFVLFFELPLL